jgi:hypothetical protein
MKRHVYYLNLLPEYGLCLPETYLYVSKENVNNINIGL